MPKMYFVNDDDEILTFKKKKKEEKLPQERVKVTPFVPADSRSAKENYQIQKQNLDIAQRNYDEALKKTYQKNHTFDFALPDIRKNNFLNSSKEKKFVFPSISNNKTNYFDTTEGKKRIAEARSEVGNLKEKVNNSQREVEKANKNLDDSDNGYHFGDITKTIGATILSTAQLFGEGTIRGMESTIDAGADLLGGASDWVNTNVEKLAGLHKGKTVEEVNREKAQARKEMIATDYTSALMKAVGKDDFYKDTIEGNSLVKSDNFGGQIVQELGRQSANILLANKIGSSNKIIQSAPIIAGSYGSGVEEAYQNNATTSEARRYGILNAATETVTEWLTGGIPGLKGTAGKGLDGIASKIIGEGVEESSKTLSKALLKSGYKLVGEGTEEALSEFINPYLKQFTYNYNSQKGVLGNLKEATNNVSVQDMMTSFIAGAITAGIIEAPSNISDIVNSTKKATILQNQVNNLQSKTNEKALFPNSTYQNQQTDINENEIAIDKYQNINEAMYDYANKIKDNFNTTINIETNKTKIPVDYSQQPQTTIFQKAKEVFSKIGKNIFQNNGDNIYVSNGDIKESIAKTVRNTEQKKILAEHIEIFSNLDRIIENGTLIAKGNETKGRSEYKKWDYYATPIKINGDNYIVEFDTVLRDNGQKHFRLERIYNLEEAIKKQVAPTDKIESQSVNRFVEQPVSVNDNTTNLTESQIAPLPSNNSNMQNIKNNVSETSFPAQPNKDLNPLELSNLTPNSANTTPKLPKVNRNKENDGDSHFAVNIENKVGMLTPEQRQTILNDIEAGHYDTITNKDSLETAFNRLNENGEAETRRWFAKDSENATATDVAEGWILLKQYADNNQSDDMVAVAKKLRDMGTKAGQTVQAFNIMARMTPEGMIKYAQSELSEAYDRMVKNKSKKWVEQHQKDFDLTPQETGAIMDIMKKVSTMEDGYDKRVELAKIQKIMTDKLPPERGAGTKAWMRISMLFNPKTQVRNVAGNAIIAPVNYFSDLFASAVDKMVGSKTGYRTTGVTNIKSYVNGFKKGVYESYNDFKKGINTRNIEGNRFEIGSGKSFNNSTTIGKSLNNVDSLLSFMLDVGDRGFYEASFVNSINNQLVLNNTKEITQDMIDIATSEALQRTWQDSNGYTKMVMSIRSSMNKLNMKGYGLGDILIPFAKTPANLTKAIVDYSPVGLVNTLIKGNNLKKAIETGQFTPQMQHQFVQSLGKAVVGTMLYVAGYALAKAGIVSGESDDDKDVRDFMKNTLGVNSYSIKIGNKTFTYDWAQPIAAPLSIMANIVQKDKSDASTLEKIVSSLDTAGNILLEQSFMESINTALNNNDGLVTGIEEAILDLPSRAIPTFMKQIVDLTDSTQRTSFEYDKPIESMVNSIKAKIPVLSKTLAPVVDTMGREVQRYGGKNNIFNVFFNPANVSTENISKSAKEIYRLYKETGDTTIMPRVAPYYLNKSGEKINLTAEQRAEYQKTSGNILEKEIKKLLSSIDYQDMSDAKKKDVIKNIVDYSYNIAQNEVLGVEISQSVQKAYEYSKIGNLSDYYLFKNNIDTTNADTKKNSITTFLLDSKLGDEELAYLYSNYYSSEDELQEIMTLKIPIKEFIKYNSQEFESDYNENTGKAISNSRKRKVIQFVNSLNLSIPQKAILIKKSYNSYDDYNKQIVNYVNNQSLSKYEKASLLKNIGFDEYDSYIINEVNSKKISRTEKERILESMGFKIINGKVYY